MARIAGIKFEKDTKGNNRYVRIDLKKFSSDITPFLEKVGAIEQDDFERRWAEALTPDEFMTEAEAMLKRKFDERNIRP